MARINIDDSLFKEEGFQDLLIYVGDRHKAKGIVWELFQLAQKYWFPEMKPIPLDVFESRDLPEILYAKGGLAELRPDGVYAKGSKAAFAWLFEKSEAGKVGGKVSATRPRDEKGRLLSKQHPNSIQAEPNTAKPLPLFSSSSSFLSSPTLTPSPALSSVCSEPSAAPPAKVKAAGRTIAVWNGYADAYFDRYGVEPTRNAAVNGKLAQFLDRVPESEAPSIAAFFVQHNGAKYVAGGHAVGLLLFDAEKLRTEWITGNRITNQDSRNAESGDALNNQLKRLGGGAT